MPTILSCGEALIDLVPVSVGGETAYVPRAGGSPYNVALALGRLGASVGFFGRMSTDPFGQLLRERLIGAGVDCGLVREGPEPTALAVVHLARDQEPRFVFYGDRAADAEIQASELPTTGDLDGADNGLKRTVALHLGSISLLREPAASAYEALIRREGQRRVLSLDPNVRPSLIRDRATYQRRLDMWLRHAAIVKVSHADLAWLAPGRAPLEVAADWIERGPSLVVVTLGADGATAVTAGGRTHPVTATVAGEHVDVRDTVGAGDAFTAGLLCWLEARGRLERRALSDLTAEELRVCLSFANRVAAIACTRTGAEPPSRHELGSGFWA